MKQISEISRISGFASRQLGVLTSIFIVGVLAISALLIGSLGFLVTGAPPWETAGGVISEAAIASTAMPSAIGVAGLLMLAVILPAVTGFGHWCLSKVTERPLGCWLLLSLAHRLVVIAQPLWTPINASIRLSSLAGVGRPLLLFAPRRTAAPTAAVLAGATPLLN